MFTRTQAWLLAISIPLALLLLFPLFYLMLRASSVEPDKTIDYLTRSSTLRVIGRSLLLVATTSFAACLISIPAAWLTTRTDLIGRKVWTVLLILPLVIPSYVGAFALIGAIGPRGMLQGWLEDGFGIERLPSIYGFWGAWLGVLLFSYPYLFLSVQAGLRGIDPALEEAALSLGKSRRQVFFTIILPQLRPFISAGALLVALYTLSDFGAVSIMQYNVFTRVIYLRLNFDFDLAALLSLVLVIFTILIMTLTIWLEGKGRYYTRGSRRAAKRIALGRWQIAAQIFCGMIVLIALVAPVGVITYWLINGLQHGEELRDVLAPLQGSMRAAAIAAAVCGLLSLPFVFLQVRFPNRYSQIIARSAYLGYALPGIVIGLSLVFFGANYFQQWFHLDHYRILPMLIFAYVVRFLPQALGPTRAGLLQVHPHLEESALTLGKPQWKVWLGITLPLMRSGWVAGMALVFLTALKELPTTLLLAPPDYDTLAVRIWSASSELFYARAAAPALVLLLISALSMVFILENDD